MKLRLPCVECKPTLEAAVSVEVEDHGIYSVTCPEGHQSLHILSNPKFEVLFEMGLLAHADGYTREAVATFAAAFEEFARFFVSCIFVKRKLHEGESWNEVEKFWKLVDRAEPQLGAFVTAYFLEFGTVPSYPDKKSIEFRNSVIHRGRIPKGAEVERYGERILQFVVPAYRKYRKGFEALLATGLEAIPEIRKRDPKLPKVSSNYPTAVSKLALRNEDPRFSDALEHAQRRTFLSSA